MKLRAFHCSNFEKWEWDLHGARNLLTMNFHMLDKTSNVGVNFAHLKQLSLESGYVKSFLSRTESKYADNIFLLLEHPVLKQKKWSTFLNDDRVFPTNASFLSLNHILCQNGWKSLSTAL